MANLVVKDPNKEIKLTGKQKKWLKYFFETMNATEAAKLAGYNASSRKTMNTIGNENMVKLGPLIQEWFCKVGLSLEAIQAKIHDGFSAKETKFFAKEGIVMDEREVEALGIQQRYVQLAANLMGYMPDQKHQLLGKDGGDLFPDLGDRFDNNPETRAAVDIILDNMKKKKSLNQMKSLDEGDEDETNS